MDGLEKTGIAEPEPEKASETARAAIIQEEFRRLEAVIVQQREHIKSWLAPFRSAVADALAPSDRHAELLTLRQERDALLAALEEDSVEDALSQIRFDNAATIAIANEIKTLEQWPSNAWPSMQDRWIYAALLKRTQQAEATLASLGLVPPAPDRGDVR